LTASPEGRKWLAELPGIVSQCVREWSLTEVGEPFPYAYASLALPVVAQERAPAVLKLQFPDRESRFEAAALAAWDGEGAVRLFAHDEARAALLIERCDPGTPLADLDLDTALDVACELLPRLWKPAGQPFTPLADEARGWADSLAETWKRTGRPYPRALLDSALDAIDSLSGSQPEAVLVNQDMHALNVLAAAREPWLVIDPKPLVGERAFGIAALVRGPELGLGRASMLRRFDRLTADLEIDRERARGWCIAQTLAWAVEDSGADDQMIAVARWLSNT
jgi:streptomycin 6-kinase